MVNTTRRREIRKFVELSFLFYTKKPIGKRGPNHKKLHKIARKSHTHHDITLRHLCFHASFNIPERLFRPVDACNRPSCSAQDVQLAWIPLDLRDPSRIRPRANACQIVLHIDVHASRHDWWRRLRMRVPNSYHGRGHIRAICPRVVSLPHPAKIDSKRIVRIGDTEATS